MAEEAEPNFDDMIQTQALNVLRVRAKIKALQEEEEAATASLKIVFESSGKDKFEVIDPDSKQPCGTISASTRRNFSVKNPKKLLEVLTVEQIAEGFKLTAPFYDALMKVFAGTDKLMEIKRILIVKDAPYITVSGGRNSKDFEFAKAAREAAIQESHEEQQRLVERLMLAGNTSPHVMTKEQADSVTAQ